jgi:hypothetical protein
MADLSQRPLMPIAFGSHAPAAAAEADNRRTVADMKAVAMPEEATAGVIDTPMVVEGATAEAANPNGASDPSSTEGLARDAAALREAVARFEIARPVADAPDDAPLLDTLAHEQRVRDDTVELTRGLARITTRSALLLAKFTDAASEFLRQSAPAATTASRRRLAGWVALGVALAGIAAATSGVALWQARENARQLEGTQRALVQAIDNNAQAQETAVRTLEARMRELTSREAALIAAIKEAQAAAAAPPPVEVEPAKREPAKATPTSRNAKRSKATR